MYSFGPTTSESVKEDASSDGCVEQEWSVEDIVEIQTAENACVVELPEGVTGVTVGEGASEKTAEATVAEKITERAASSAVRAEVLTGWHSGMPWPLRRMNSVSGRYRGRVGRWQLELRLDVDGRRPMRCVSGDFYYTSGATTSYFGSFVVQSPRLRVTARSVTIEGYGTYTWSAVSQWFRVVVQRRPVKMRREPAVLQFFSNTGRPGAKYSCQFESLYFRTVQYEQDYEQGVTPFVSYDTGSLPSGGPGRTLSVAEAYAEVGIEMQNTGTWNVIPTTGAGSNAMWSNAELHASMVRQFSLWKNEPRWKVWVFAGNLHEIGPRLYGIMFDQQGSQRQGCATFHAGIGGTSADRLRLQLYTYVHELGHSFNLMHSWQKSYAVPSAPNRPQSLSWMNYPQRYSGGDLAFWSAFPFQFDNHEVMHLRHAFRNNIIMGGSKFTVGAALEDPEAFADPVEDNSGLRLELEPAKKSFAYGEPVVIEIKLRTTDERDKKVHANLHPNMDFVQIGIRKPSGQVVVYKPLMEHCVSPDEITLDVGCPSVYESAYIGYGKAGFYFDQVGLYQIRAVYYALDGSLVLSGIGTLRVHSPFNSLDEEVAELFFGDDQGQLLYLLGSDSESLHRGNEAFNVVLDKHANHPMSVYARMVKGINDGREFKLVSPKKEISVRKPKYDACIDLLCSVVDVSEAGKGMDNITLNMIMRSLASAQKSTGDKKGSKATMGRMVTLFRKKSLRPHVLQKIEAQSKEI